jgi:site-specific recombinase XerD
MANPFRGTIRPYTTTGHSSSRSWAASACLTPARSIHREHVEAFSAAELARTAPSSAATRYRCLQQLFGWLDEEGEINEAPMAKTRPPKIREKPVPVLPGAASSASLT